MKGRATIVRGVRRLPCPHCRAPIVAGRFEAHRAICAPKPAPRKPGESCACGNAVTVELRSASEPMRRACGVCAERAPMTTHVRPLVR